MGDGDLDCQSVGEQFSSQSRRKSIHQALGGGAIAEALLWKRWTSGAFLLVSTTAFWFLFEWAGYGLLSFVANVLLLLVIILFLWAKSACLLNRPLPPLPDLEVSEDFVGRAAGVARVWVNRLLKVAHDISLGGDVKLFLQVIFGLWLVSYIGSLFSFLTLVYIGALISLTVPALYDKYQDHVDDKLYKALEVLSTHYRKIDNILSKIPRPVNKEKKIQ
ncbi:reticulon-like protein B11 isoform X2 [Telopea speciosissima]|uniref:reticulon-like protein B11 isoform X1 n=1 Tax=Telopea speciosissima TaxID=54955 RepID=UPI001CC50E43|nr:reticulon-like protein B11 isoform X1 [Telopea speciosissima]XP_043697624.1 reticulon-like protein B11 isoform X2 [Telopea speciosissima]